MKLKVNDQLIENTCPKCDDKAYAKKAVQVTCSKCKKPMQPGLLFSASMTHLKPVIYNVNKD